MAALSTPLIRNISRITQEFRKCARMEARRSTRSESRPPRDSCTPSQLPPCPPCESAERPPCRAEPASHVRAMRHVCCPPPRGMRPPCPDPVVACAMTCENAVTRNNKNTFSSSTSKGMSYNIEKGYKKKSCSAERDHVARRIDAAKRVRQEDYELEVARRFSLPKPSMPSLEPYYLGVERECARATDGRDYVIPCKSNQKNPPAQDQSSKTPTSCGPNRTPPSPRCVELLPDDACQIRRSSHVDPCAHHPRILLEIDRSGEGQSTQRVTSSHKQSTSKCKEASETKGKFSSHLMESLNLGQKSAASCPRKEFAVKCEGHGAKKAGDSDWCKNLPKPTPSPSRCRELTLAEKLRNRSTGSCKRTHKPSGIRKFHTSAIINRAKKDSKTQAPTTKNMESIIKQEKANNEKLKIMLRDRQALKESGQGRTVKSQHNKNESHNPPTAGQLDIRVLPGTEHVRVKVTLDGKTHSQPELCSSQPAHSPAVKEASTKCRSSSEIPLTSEKRESWLSIKSLQKNFFGCQKSDDKSKNDDSCRAKLRPCPPPCPPRKRTNLCPSPENVINVSKNPCGPSKTTPPTPKSPCEKQPAKSSPKITSPCGPSKPASSPKPEKHPILSPPKPIWPCGPKTTPPAPKSPCEKKTTTSSPKPTTSPCGTPKTTPQAPPSPCGPSKTAPSVPKSPCDKPSTSPVKPVSPCGPSKTAPSVPKSPCDKPSTSPVKPVSPCGPSKTGSPPKSPSKKTCEPSKPAPKSTCQEASLKSNTSSKSPRPLCDTSSKGPSFCPPSKKSPSTKRCTPSFDVIPAVILLNS